MKIKDLVSLPEIKTVVQLRDVRDPQVKQMTDFLKSVGSEPKPQAALVRSFSEWVARRFGRPRPARSPRPGAAARAGGRE